MITLQITTKEAQIIALVAITWLEQANLAEDQQEIKEANNFANKILPALANTEEYVMLSGAMVGKRPNESGIIL